jgi:hypothetical protein
MFRLIMLITTLATRKATIYTEFYWVWDLNALYMLLQKYMLKKCGSKALIFQTQYIYYFLVVSLVMIFLGRNRHLLFQHFVAFSCPIYNTLRSSKRCTIGYSFSLKHHFISWNKIRNVNQQLIWMSYPPTQAGHGCFNASKVVPLRCH